MGPNDTAHTAAGRSLAHASSSALVPFAALVLAMLPAVLDQTILATALPTVASDLGSLDDVSWLVTVYVVAATATMPLWGKLGDRHGHKRLLELSLGLFVIASTACAAMQTIGELIVARGIQGAAAGGLMTLAMAAVGDLVAPRERGRYQGYIAATFAAATVVGPLLGGVLVDVVSWRWVFLVNLPVGVVALLVLSAKLPAPRVEAPRARLDLLGAALVAGASAALMLVCVWGGDRYAWDSAPIVALGLAAVGLALALVARERRAADPVVPLALLATPVVAIASAALFLATAALFAVTVFVPLFMQASVGLTPTEAGLLLVPMMAGTTASTTIAGRIMAATGRYKRFPLIGLALMAGALALLAATASAQSVVAAGIALTVFGVGFGMVTQILLVAIQNGVERRTLGTATAAAGFFRALGGAVGAAVLGAVFAAQAGVSASGVAGQLSVAARDAIADAAGTVFAVATPIAVLALLVALWLPEARLQTREG
jgi:EmrB/QacA subfamily drug resistance transporter